MRFMSQQHLARQRSTAAGSCPGTQLYRPFFQAGIVVVLTLGAAWGAFLLLQIAAHGSFTAIGIHEVNAHGHAQIFGWVGLFVMGFAYFALPQMKQVDLIAPRLAYASLWLMAGGLVVRSLAQALVPTAVWFGLPGVAGSLAEIVAIAICVTLVTKSLSRSLSGLSLPDGYVLAGLSWFLVQAVYETVYFAALLMAGGREQTLELVATWQGPLREIQIHGFAMLMILGVSQQLLPRLYGMAPVSARLSRRAFVLLNVAIVGMASGLLLMRLAGHRWAALWYLSVLLLAATTVLLVLGLRLHTEALRRDRALKFIRAAYIWLLISLGMLVLLPVYQFGLLPWLAPESHAREIGFSHAYYGAIRHAVTVGFVSLMIVGVSARMVPEFVQVDVHGLSSLWSPFLLLNLGCALRVAFQTLTDFTPLAFPMAGVSGLLELTALGLWGAHLWRLMRVPRAVADLSGYETATAL